MGFSPSTFDNILVMGKSGAGKQSRVDVFESDFGLKQLSTGHIFRSFMKIVNESAFNGDINQFYNTKLQNFISDAEIKNVLGSKIDDLNIDDFILGLKADFYIKNGYYVPDELTNKIFGSCYAQHNYRGLILDGYPRTMDQAEFLLDLANGNGTRLNAIILVENEDEIIINRTIGRRICPNCGSVFHVEYKPPKDGKYCTNCRTEVITRSDDTKEKLQTRLKEFINKTMPAINYLAGRGIPLVKVNGNFPVFTHEAVKKDLYKKMEDMHLI